MCDLMKKKVSIIIPNWNGKKFIEVCLRSVLASQFDETYEVIVVDNGSTDGSREMAQAIFDGQTEVCVPDTVRTHSVHLPKNMGFARACNEGMYNAQGEYIVLLNNDVEVATDWLQELVAGMERHPDCGMGTSKMIQYDNHDQFYNTGDVFDIRCAGGGRGFGVMNTGQYEEEEYVFGACAGAGIYRRSLFEEIGYFDEDFFIFAEDVDINLRAQLVNQRCIYLPKALVYHWGTATVGFNSNRHVFLFCRNDLFVLVKNYTLKEFCMFAKRITRRIFERAVDYSLEGQGRSLFLSRLSFLWFLPGMVVRRIALQGQRKRGLLDIPEITR